MAQAKALDALEPFVVLAKSASSPRAAADLVARATSHPSTYVFAELLQTAQIQALESADPEYAAYLLLLRIFSYGTYADYEQGYLSSALSPSAAAAAATVASPKPLPPLDEAQITKLRQLSLISLATDRASLTYAHLVSALRLPDVRALEDLVVSAIYAGLVSATLDPAHAVVRISSVAPLRDLAPGTVPRLRQSLQAWSGRCEATLVDLDAQIAEIRRVAAAKAEKDRAWDAQYNRALEHERERLNNTPNSFATSDHGKAPMTLLVANSDSTKSRFMKRTSNSLNDGSGAAAGSSTLGGAGPAGRDVVPDDYMDIDEDGGAEGSKRAS